MPAYSPASDHTSWQKMRMARAERAARRGEANAEDVAAARRDFAYSRLVDHVRNYLSAPGCAPLTPQQAAELKELIEQYAALAELVDLPSGA